MYIFHLYTYKFFTRGIREIYTPAIEQSDWSECTSHGTNYVIYIVPLPRYARVNILKTSRIEMEEKLINSGYELVSQEEFFSHCCRAHNTCDGLCRRFCNDDHIPDLFAFCSCAPLTETEFYTSGSIILQDKVSM